MRPACCSALGSPREAFIQPVRIGSTTRCAPGYSCPWLRAFLSVLIWHPDAVAGVRETPLHVAFAACHATREKGKVSGRSQKDGSLSWAQELGVSARTTFCFLEAHGGFLRSRPDWGLDYLRWPGGRGCRAATMVSRRDPSETSRERPSTTRAPNTAPSSDGLNLMNLQLHSHVSCHIAAGIGTAFETPTCPAGAGQGTPTPHILCLQAIANHRKCGTRSFPHRNG